MLKLNIIKCWINDKSSDVKLCFRILFCNEMAVIVNKTVAECLEIKEIEEFLNLPVNNCEQLDCDGEYQRLQLLEEQVKLIFYKNNTVLYFLCKLTNYNFSE